MPDSPILTDVSFTIPAGAMVGLSGPSGAGKSTLADLACGLLVASTGEIRVGGARLDAATAETWAARVSYVPQEAFLLNDSVRANLLWGAGVREDKHLWEALEAVGAAARVKEMGGLDAPVGERGNRLSGGERQRLGLARALLRPAELMLLDEATNALDAPSEAKLLDTIAALSPRPTLLLISHSEAVLGRCERVLFLDRGRLIADRRQSSMAAT
jgi:ATP-binding cassette subfamily C protein